MPKRKRSGMWLLVPGLLLIAFSMVQLLGAPDMLEYVVAAPAPTEVTDKNPPESGENQNENGPGGDKENEKKMTNEALGAYIEGVDERLTEMADALYVHTVAADRAGCPMASDNEGSADARMLAVGENYFDAYPKYLLSGRLPDPDELKYGDPVIALDIDLAIKLFGIAEPIDRVVTIEEHEFTVIGVVRHARQPGEYDLFSGYIPLKYAQKQGMTLHSVTVSAAPVPRSGASSTFGAAMKEIDGNGDFYDLSKEATRQWVLLRLTLVALAAWVLARGFRLVNRFVADAFRAYRDRLRREYARDMLGGMALKAAGALAAYAALLAAVWSVAMFAIDPVYIFPEWIPAVLVEPSDIIATFWSLATSAAEPVVRVTSDYKWITFYGVILRWGLIMSLIGGLMFAMNKAIRSDKI